MVHSFTSSLFSILELVKLSCHGWDPQVVNFHVFERENFAYLIPFLLTNGVLSVGEAPRHTFSSSPFSVLYYSSSFLPASFGVLKHTPLSVSSTSGRTGNFKSTPYLWTLWDKNALWAVFFPGLQLSHCNYLQCFCYIFNGDPVRNSLLRWSVCDARRTFCTLNAKHCERYELNNFGLE